MARSLAGIPDKQALGLIATKLLGAEITGYLERVMGNRERRRHTPFFEEESPSDRLIWRPHQQAQACLTTKVGELGLPLAEATRIPAPLLLGAGWAF